KFAERHSGQENVVGEARLAGHFCASINSAPRDTDHAKVILVDFWRVDSGDSRILFIRHAPSRRTVYLAGKSGCRSFLTCDLQHRGFDGFENLKIAGTAA